MRTIYLILVLFVASCASQKTSMVTQKPATVTKEPTVVVPREPETPPRVCEALVNVINRGDWDALKDWAKPGSTTNETLLTWQKAAESGHPVKVGKFLNVQTVGERSQRPYKLYSYSMENKDGTVNPHWLQIKVREEDGKAEIVDFWNLGW
jgi:hypothetical protein